MKQHTLLRPVAAAIIGLMLLVDSSCNAPQRREKELVLFYDVPLVCGAAPDIGCGSRAKPVFIDLERQPNIKEAWLNRSGTVIAVVGGPSVTDRQQIVDIAEPIFKNHDLEVRFIGETKCLDSLMSDFHGDGPPAGRAGKWYRGVDVDQLSIEEAGRLAEKAVKFAREGNLISEGESKAIKADVEAYMKTELVKVRTLTELEEADERWHADVYGIYQKHIGTKRAGEIRKFFEANQSGDHEE